MTVAWASFGFHSRFLQMILRPLMYWHTEWRVGEVSDNRLNIECLARRFVIMEEVCRAWRIWQRRSLKSEIGVRTIFEEIMVSLCLLMFRWSPLVFLVEQQIINQQSSGLWTWFILKILFFVRSSFLKIEASLDTLTLASRDFFVPLRGLLSPKALSIMFYFLAIHLAIMSQNACFLSLLVRGMADRLTEGFDNLSL